MKTMKVAETNVVSITMNLGLFFRTEVYYFEVIRQSF